MALQGRGSGAQQASARRAPPAAAAATACRGCCLHLDGSSHAWFADGRRYDLLVVLDDATSEIYYAQLVEQESTRTVLSALREVVETQGRVLRAV